MAGSPSDGERVLEICRDLEESIRAGKWEPGQSLPTYVKLREMYAVGSHTITRVVSRLKRKGLVEARQGGRVKVLKQRKVRTIDAMRYVDAAHPDRNPSPNVQVHRMADRLGGHGYYDESPPPPIAEAFGLADGELALNRRFALVEDDEMICLIDSWEPGIVKETNGGSFDQEPWRGDVVGQLRAAGHDITWLTESITNEFATDDQAKQLGMSLDEPLLVVTRHAYQGKQLVEIADVAYPAFHTRLVYPIILERPDLYHGETR